MHNSIWYRTRNWVLFSLVVGWSITSYVTTWKNSDNTLALKLIAQLHDVSCNTADAPRVLPNRRHNCTFRYPIRSSRAGLTWKSGPHDTRTKNHLLRPHSLTKITVNRFTWAVLVSTLSRTPEKVVFVCTHSSRPPSVLVPSLHQLFC